MRCVAAARRTSRDIRLLVLGSSALLIQTGLSESLTGRFFLHRCSHWTFQECVDAFGWDLPRWLYFGGYPGAAAFCDDERKLFRVLYDEKMHLKDKNPTRTSCGQPAGCSGYGII